jgi:hypothetical protein
MLRIGRTVTPGWRRSISTKLMPACFFTVLSVRTSANMWLRVEGDAGPDLLSR